MPKRRLGKGIDALLQGRPLDQLQQMSSIQMVDIENISPNPDQPRKRFDETTLSELADSIREKGIIQPIIAEDRGDGTYIIIAGERRYRAAKIAGLDEVPVISQDLSDEDKLEIALIENIQREDLNPIDEARAFQHAIEQGGITQDQLAKRLGKSRSAVANTIRLLRLKADAQDALASGELTAGHARALLALTHDEERARLFSLIMDRGLSVREAEAMVRGGVLDESALERLHRDGAVPVDETVSDGPGIAVEQEELEVPGGGSNGGSGSRDGAGQKSLELQRLEDRLVEHLGTRVVIRGSDDRGKIEIAYLSTDDLERIVESMGAPLPD